MTKTPPALPALGKLHDYFQTHKSTTPKHVTIAVPLTWPDIKNAEYEVIKRFCTAAENIGSRIIVTDNNGYPVWSSDDAPIDTSRPIGPGDADFMISLHFETPRLIDLYSYYAIWQPVDFYFEFGYEGAIEKLLTHHDALSCDSEAGDAHVRALMAATHRAPDAPFPHLFHSPSEPYHAPVITKDSRLFYIGINWERLGSSKGRHHELLERLNEEDLIDIYGPRVFLGKRPWEGFANYRGEIPFDGSSVVKALNKSGICLAISSRPHQNSGVMSNRLFEGLAAGTAIISNPHPIVDKYFSDVVYEIDDTVSDEEIFFQVSGIIEEIRANPEEANERARIGQERLRELFSLEKCLQALIDQHDDRAAAHAQKALSSDEPVTVVFAYPDMRADRAQEALADLETQAGVKVRLVLVCDPAFATGPGRALIERLETSLDRVTVVDSVFGKNALQPTRGHALKAALDLIDTDSFAVMGPGAQLFSEHLGSLARCLHDAPDALAAAAGMLEEDYEGPGRNQKIRRAVAGLKAPSEPRVMLSDNGMTDPGRYLFRTALTKGLNTEVLPLLDGQEITYLLVNALADQALEQTGMATYVRIKPDAHTNMPTQASLLRQRQFIRDALKFDTKLAALAQTITPLPPTETQKAAGDTLFYPRLFLGRIVDVRTGSDGLRFLGAGFSTPEERAVWIDGLTGNLHFRLADAQPEDHEDLELVCVLAGRQSDATGRAQHCTISVNGITLGYFQLTDRETPIVVKLPHNIAEDGVLRVQIAADHAERVANPDGSPAADPRRLGIYVTGVGVMRRDVTADLPSVLTDTTYELTRRGTGRALLLDGAYPEDDAIWMNDGPARLQFRLDEPSPRMRVTLEMASVQSDTEGDPIEMAVALNDLPATHFELSETARKFSLMIEPHSVGTDGVCTLILTPSDARRRRGSNRILSAALSALKVTDLTAIEIGHTYTTAHRHEGAAFLKTGFSTPEDDFTWIDGQHANLSGAVDIDEDASSYPDLTLVLNLGGLAPKDSAAHVCTITVNGEKLTDAEITPGEDTTTLSLDLPDKLIGPHAATLSIDFDLEENPEQITDSESGDVLDPRRLGIHLKSFALLAR